MIIIGALTYFSSNAPILDEINLEAQKDVIEDIIEHNIIREKYNSAIKEFDRFLEDLAIRESSNNWTIYNPYGYIGLYQIGYAARYDTGYGHVTFKGFVENPNIFPKDHQKSALIKLVQLNVEILSPEIGIYDGVYINGTKLTRSGMIAGAHLGGAYGMKLFILTEGRYNPADINGTKISDYVEEFAGYNFRINLNFLI